MSPQRLRGWEPVEVQTPKYDESGRVVSVRVEREPEWTPEQLSLVLGVEEYDRMLGPHGFPMDEATSNLADPSNRDGEYVFKAGVLTTTPEGVFVRAPLRDFVEQAKHQAAEMWQKSAGENADQAGIFWPVERVDRER